MSTTPRAHRRIRRRFVPRIFPRLINHAGVTLHTNLRGSRAPSGRDDFQAFGRALRMAVAQMRAWATCCLDQGACELISRHDYGMGNLRSVSKAIEHVAPAASVVVTSTLQ